MKKGSVRNNRPSSTQLNASTDLDPVDSPICGAVKAFHYQQIAQIIERYSTPTPAEPCLSPLLWSESFGLRLDG